ncbi:MaoC family dehydratase [Shewanella youngdeokensis]|uniref:MaoC/PaaZ C-terminal domain-containing protein n=1 Tax=Shewanella youngdeokensis TaxID=2999068 RepID=A0ABZ0K4R8_9GAMM|nr:MaoC/PaaZ C-terminal domain-containing protein [Shewanella sp. DAU334]
MPSLFSLYRKIFFGRKPGWDEQPLPKIHVSINNVALAKDKIEQYANVCGFEFDGHTLPPTSLYVMAFRLHTVIFTHDGITFPLLGMIHLKNSITVHRPTTILEQYDFECSLVSSEQTDSGLEFALLSKAFVNGELVWESLSTYLYRIEGKTKRIRPPKGGDINWDTPQAWSLSEDLGRRYAKASGDYNLIHLHPLLSKRFGFDRILAHGMWSKGRCIAQIMPQIANKPCKIDVAFKLPLFMPADVTFAAEMQQDKLIFELRDKKGRRPHLTGDVTFL